MLAVSPRQIHQVIDLFFESGVAFSAPHQPQLEHVIMTPALDRFVAGVIRQIVVFVLLE